MVKPTKNTIFLQEREKKVFANPVTWWSGNQNSPFHPDLIIIANSNHVLTFCRQLLEEIKDSRIGRGKRQKEDEKKSSGAIVGEISLWNGIPILWKRKRRRNLSFISGTRRRVDGDQVTDVADAELLDCESSHWWESFQHDHAQMEKKAFQLSCLPNSKTRCSDSRRRRRSRFSHLCRWFSFSFSLFLFFFLKDRVHERVGCESKYWAGVDVIRDESPKRKKKYIYSTRGNHTLQLMVISAAAQ